MLRHSCPRTRGFNIIMINIVPKTDLQTQCNPYQTPGHIFIDIGKVRPSGSNLTCIPNFLLQLLRWVPNIKRRVHQMHVCSFLCSMFSLLSGLWGQRAVSSFPTRDNNIHSLSNYLLNTHYMSTIVPGATHPYNHEESRENFSPLKELSFQ